jgi:hypothetical protein
MRIVSQRLPQVHDALDQRILGNRRVFPESIQEFVFGDQAVPSLDQENQDIERLRPEADFPTVAGDQATGDIDFEIV